MTTAMSTAVGSASASVVGGDGVPTPDAPRDLIVTAGWSDRVFRGLLRTSGTSVLVIISLIGIFLAIRGFDAIHQAGWSFLTERAWSPNSRRFGIAAILPGTAFIAIVAVLIAFPLALGAALYISEYAPRQVKQTLIAIVDLMAAVPSIVFGLWGAYFLTSRITGLSRFLSTYLGWIPIFKVDGTDPHDPLLDITRYNASTFIAGLVVALMVTPIACSVMREVFSQTPPGEREGAFALGATRFGMIRSVVLPFGKAGMIGGTMLGLGRALGETIAVYLIISPTFKIQPHILQNGASSVSSTIALKYQEATPFSISALMAAGLALFLVTLVVNFAASSVVARSRSGASS